MKGVSLFSSAGIAELYFEKININIQIVNELESKDAIYTNIYIQILRW